MTRGFRLFGLAALVVLLTGCPQIFDALTNSTNPHSLSASTGDGSAINVSWSAPNLPQGDTRTVDHYNVYRDSSLLTTTGSTSYSDSGPPPAEEHSYSVTATYSDFSVSGSSNSASGWYVPSHALELGTGPGSWSTGGTAVTSDGWFRTLVVAGWTYHFESTSSVTLSIGSWDSPWSQVPLGSGTSFPWTADRTGKVWVRVQASASVRAWYD